MAQISFEELANGLAGGSSSVRSDVRYFSCQENEDVVVRFLHDSTDSFDIHTVHEV